MRWLLTTLVLLAGVNDAALAGEIPWDKVAGVKLTDFKPEFVKQVEVELERLPCYGSCSKTIAQCLRSGKGSTAARLAKGIVNLMASGAQHEKLLEWVEQRKRMAHPELDHHFELRGATPLGPVQAPVVIVEFTDFKCPYCARVAPVLERVIKEARGQARLYLKMFPLKSHPGAVSAAKACVAAGRLGKLWEYCPLLFLNQSRLDEATLLSLARQVGLDGDSFAAEMAKPEVVEQVANDKMEGLRAIIRGTPAIFINGKRFEGEPTVATLLDRVEEEIDIANGRD